MSSGPRPLSQPSWEGTMTSPGTPDPARPGQTRQTPAWGGTGGPWHRQWKRVSSSELLPLSLGCMRRRWEWRRRQWEWRRKASPTQFHESEAHLVIWKESASPTPYCFGSQLGVTLLPTGHPARSKDIFDCHAWGGWVAPGTQWVEARIMQNASAQDGAHTVIQPKCQ